MRERDGSMAEMMNLKLTVFGEADNIRRFYNMLVADTKWMDDPPKEDDEYILADGISWADLTIAEDNGLTIGIIEGETKYSVREWNYRMNSAWPSADGNKVLVTFDMLTKILDLDVIIDGYYSCEGEVTEARFCCGNKMYFRIYEYKEEEE